jgi:PAS domain-containing protein
MVYTPLIWPLLITVLISPALLVYARRDWGMPGALQFHLLLWLGTLVAAIYTLEISVRWLPAEIFLNEVRLVPLAFIPPTELALALAYLGYTNRLSWKHWIALYSIPALAALLSLIGSYPAAGSSLSLFRYNFQPANGTVPFLVFQRGAFWYVYYAYTLLVTAATCALLIRSFHTQPQRAHTSRLILTALLLPTCIDILFVLGLTPSRGFYWTAAFFPLSGCLLAWTLLRGRMFNFKPIARRYILDQISDLVIVLDLDNHIVDFNHAAQAVCGLTNAAIGCLPEQALAPQWAAILHDPAARLPDESIDQMGHPVYS